LNVIKKKYPNDFAVNMTGRFDLFILLPIPLNKQTATTFLEFLQLKAVIIVIDHSLTDSQITGSSIDC